MRSNNTQIPHRVLLSRALVSKLNFDSASSVYKRLTRDLESILLKAAVQTVVEEARQPLAHLMM